MAEESWSSSGQRTSGAGRRRCSPTGREIPTPSEFDPEIGREIDRIEQAIRDKDDRVLKEYGDLQACLKRIVELNDVHRSSSPGTMIHGFATWRSRRLPGGRF